MAFWFRNRSWGLRRRDTHQEQNDPVLPLTIAGAILNNDNGDDDDEDSLDMHEHDRRLSRYLLVLAQNHLLALVICFYILYAICRFGFGWDPTDKNSQPPPTYTIHIPGIT